MYRYWYSWLEKIWFRNGLNIKGEIHSKIESIWKERVHLFLQNSEKMMKIGWEIRKIGHFEISHFFGKHFLTSPYEYSNERVDDVIPSQFSIHFIYRNDKNLIFQLWEYKTCLITTQSIWEIMFTLIHFDMGICFYLYELKMKILQNFIYNKIYEKLWGDDIINSLIWIFIRTGQEVFSKKMWNFKMS